MDHETHLIQSDDNATVAGSAAAQDRGSEARQIYGRRAAAILRVRRRITDFFDPSLFADPAFDILLALFAADEAGERASVSDVCLASNVPNTTALRWIGLLEKHGLLCRSPDPEDRRRSYVAMTPLARKQMQQWLSEITSVPPQ